MCTHSLGVPRGYRLEWRLLKDCVLWICVEALEKVRAYHHERRDTGGRAPIDGCWLVAVGRLNRGGEYPRSLTDARA